MALKRVMRIDIYKRKQWKIGLHEAVAEDILTDTSRLDSDPPEKMDKKS